MPSEPAANRSLGLLEGLRLPSLEDHLAEDPPELRWEVDACEIAGTIGRPSAVRAVARSNGDNRLAILIPCHRVIGSDGTLTGYGGGLWRKKRLLELESGQLSALV